MCLVFKQGPCIPDCVKIKATYSALQTWIELFSMTFGERTESHDLFYTVAWSILCFHPRFCFGSSRLRKAGTVNSLPPLSHRCCVSLYDFIINGCQCVWLEREEQREPLEATCAILAQPLSQSKCKWLQVMRKDSGCPFSIDTLLLCCSIPLSLLPLCPRSSLFGSLSGY